MVSSSGVSSAGSVQVAAAVTAARGQAQLELQQAVAAARTEATRLVQTQAAAQLSTARAVFLHGCQQLEAQMSQQVGDSIAHLHSPSGGLLAAEAGAADLRRCRPPLFPALRFDHA